MAKNNRIAFEVTEDGRIINRANEKKSSNKKTNKKKKKNFFEQLVSGTSLEDGYDFGDITKTAGKTLLSGANLLGQGVMKGVEGIADAGMQIGSSEFNPFMHLLYKGDIKQGQKDAQKIIKKDATKNLITNLSGDENFNKNFLDKDSLIKESNLGGKVVQSVGQQLPSMLLSGGTSMALNEGISLGTMGVSSYGAGVEEAYKQGKNRDTANKYGLINSTIETATEKMFAGIGGAFGKGALDDAVKNKITKNISNALTKTVVDTGLDMVGEGTEEVVGDLLQPIAQKLSGMSKEKLSKLYEDQNYAEDFVLGALSAGVMGGARMPSTYKQNKANVQAGRNMNTGLTSNEQSVIDNVVEKRYNEQIKNKNLSKRQLSKIKTKIENEVRTDLENGFIDIDDIESTLGGEAYTNYKTANNRKSEIEKRIQELESKPISEMTLGQQNNSNEEIKALKEELDNLEINDLKDNLFNSVVNKTKSDDLLQRSYEEKGKRSQAFTYELSDTDSDIKKKVYESASKIMNDTKKTHNIVEIVSKIADDRGTNYEFVNSEQLKEMGYKTNNNKIINGVKTKDGNILINIDSNNALNRILGHETTHLVENTDDYKLLQESVFEYAKTKGDYDKKLSEIMKNYEGQDVDINEELTSDLVGDYLFTDEEFINELSTKQPNIFQKVYNYIKHVYKMATAGSKEQRQLEKVKYNFEKVYKNNNSLNTNDKYMMTSVKGMENGIKVSNRYQDIKNRYNEALKMKNDSNNTNEDIRQKTGWFQNNEGNWEFEIADINTKFKKTPKQNTKYKLGDIFEASTLYDMYPELKDVKVSLKDMKGKGSYYYLTKSIGISNKLVNDTEDMRGTLLHEIQHYIQNIEGLPEGTSILFGNEFYANSKGEIEASDTKRRMDLDVDERKEIIPESAKKNPVHPHRDAILRHKRNNIEKIVEKLYNKHGDKANEIVEEFWEENKEKDFQDNSRNSRNGLIELENSSFSLNKNASNIKQKQLDIINKFNPAPDDNHTWIRSIDDIKTFNEAFFEDGEYSGFDPDFTEEMAKESMENGKITIYSSYPIENGIFVSPSKLEASQYAGGDESKLYSKTVNIDDVAWIDGAEGQYAKASDTNYSISNEDLAPVSKSVLIKDNKGRILTKEQQNFFKNSKIVDDKGNLMEVYHGTNSDDFNIFDENYIGGANDKGWYGKGFYFATHEGEAKTYGDNVKKAYLDIKNPFNFREQMLSYDGQTSGDVNYDFGSFMLNLNEKFPEIAQKETITYGNYDKNGNIIPQKMTLSNLAEEIKEVYDSPNLKISEYDDGGTTKYGYTYGKNIDDYKIPSKIKSSIKDNGIYNLYDAQFAKENPQYYPHMTSKEIDDVLNYYKNNDVDFGTYHSIYQTSDIDSLKNSRLSEATYYVTRELNKYVDTHIPEVYMQSFGDELSDILKSKGYDGVIQSSDGDEIVAFYPNQIKNVDNTNPTNSNDIRYSLGINSETSKFDIYGEDVKVEDAPLIKHIEETIINKNNDKNSLGYIPKDPTKESSYDSDKIKEYNTEEGKKRYVDKKIQQTIAKQSYKQLNKASKTAQFYLEFDNIQKKEFKSQIDKFIGKNRDELINARTYNEIKDIINGYSNKEIKYVDEQIRDVKSQIRKSKIKITGELKKQITDYSYFRKTCRLNLGKDGISVDSLWQELSSTYPYYFDEDITSQADQIDMLSAFMYEDDTTVQKYEISETEIDNITSKVYNSLLQNSFNEEDIKDLQQNLEEASERRTRQVVREEMLNEMGITDRDLSVGNDISAFSYQRTDPVRLNEKVFGYEIGKKINDATINRTKHNEAERIRWLNKERSLIKELGIKARSKESSAVQKYGEGKYYDDAGNIHEYGDWELEKEFHDVKTQNKIKNASKIIRECYDRYIDEINSTLIYMGYNPIPKRTDYFRHFYELNDKLSKWGVPFNKNDMRAEDLPTDINGLTDQFKPGKNFFASSLERLGNRTTYDAITGIDGYLDGASNLIFHTEDIQRYRALSKYIRDSYGKNGLENLDSLSNSEIEQRINDIQNNKLSKYVAWLDEQANALAGKKGTIDRSVERFLGRRVYTALNTLKTQVGSNMTGFNVRSALTNFASAIQGASKTNKIAFIKGTLSTVNNIIHDDGLINKSDFLTSRFGSDNLSKKMWQKISNAGQIFMTGSDYFTSNQIWRSKYYENLSKNMTEEEAIRNADDFSSRIMGDRSKGSTAEIFNSKTLGFLTQFQLEVNNQWSSMIHDNKMDIQSGNKTGASVVFMMGQLFAMSNIFNGIMKSMTGSDVMFDPIEILKNMFDSDDDKTMEEKATEALGDVVNQLPMASILTGGRIPIQEAFKGASTLLKKATNQKNEYGQSYTWDNVKDDLLSSLPYFVMPTGYGQLKKTASGLSMYDEKLPIAGSYTKSGNLRFTADDTPIEKLKTGLFGQYASKNAQNYIDSGFKSIKSGKNNKHLAEIIDLGMNSSQYREYQAGLQKAGKKIDEKLEYINKLDISNKKKNIMVKNILSKSSLAKYEKYINDGGTLEQYYNFKIETKGMINNGKEKYLFQSNLSDKQKQSLYENYVLNNYDDENKNIKYKLAKSMGIDINSWLNYSSQNFEGNKNALGKTVNGSRQRQVFNFINKMNNLNIIQKAILMKTEFSGFHTYDKQIFDYINNLNISVEEKIQYAKDIGFKVRNGRVMFR